MRVLVTGGAGFIGSHVVDRLAAAGHEPRILDTRPSPWHDDVDTVIGDVRRIEDVRGALRDCDAVCHLAAAADVGEVIQAPAESTELNAMGTLSVLEAARLEGVKRVAYASTVWVYSAVAAADVNEDTLLPCPDHVYTAGKLSGELLCHSYAELYGLETTVLRFGIPYGPRARPAAVIPSFVERARKGEALTIAGTGEQQRVFVYVEDLAEGVVRGLAPAAIGRTYNLAGRETTTIRGLAEIVQQEVGGVEILHTEGRAGDLAGAAVCSKRAEAELGWTACTPLREGVRRYVTWLDEQPPAELVPARTEHPRTEHARAVAGRLAHAVAEPVFAGATTMIAVTAALVAAIIGAEESQAAYLLVTGLAVMLPLWTLAMSPWPAERRRLQTRLVIAAGVLSVGLIGVLSSRAPGPVHTTHLAIWLVLSASLASALQRMSRRAAVSERD
jgi:UDP-glucose 4-epimerase